VPLPELVERVAREFAVALEAGHVVVDRAVVDDVAMPLVHQRLGEIDHLLDVLGGLRVEIGRPDPERSRIVEHRIGVLLRDLLGREALVLGRELHLVDGFGGRFVGHVANVGDVHHLCDREALELERAADQVVEHEAPEVPEMRVPIDGRAAGIHLHVTRFDRVYLLEGARQ